MGIGSYICFFFCFISSTVLVTLNSTRPSYLSNYQTVFSEDSLKMRSVSSTINECYSKYCTHDC